MIENVLVIPRVYLVDRMESWKNRKGDLNKFSGIFFFFFFSFLEKEDIILLY